MNFKELLKDTDYTFTTNEKAPEWLYKVMGEKGAEVLFAKRDRKKWKVVMDYDWFVDNFIGDKSDDYLVCPHCGRKIIK